MKKKILIIGNSAREYALAKILSKNNEIYVAPGSPTIKEFATCVDIRENSVTELLEFAMENGIELTIPVSIKALDTNIVDLFSKNNLQIFAPCQEASRISIDKCSAKKILYKLRIPTAKFGIFEKQNMAMDYIKNLKKPYVIKTNEPSSAVVLTSAQMGKNILDSLFTVQNQKVLIEDYIWGTPFSFYTITDGYKALPIGSSIVYKHSLEGDGGQLTSGTGACSPNYKLSLEQEYAIMDNIIYPTLEFLESEGNAYIGILGVNGILTDDGDLNVLGYNSFFQDCDTTAILSNINTDLYKLFVACIIGSFSDEFDVIEQNDISATSIVLSCKNKENIENVINGLDSIDDDIYIDYFPTVNKNKYLELEAQTGSVLVLTATGATLSKATQKAYDEIECINFKGKSFRKDICKPVKSGI